MRPAGNNWLKKAGTGGDLVFLSLYGGGFTPTWLGAVMKRYIIGAGITRPTSPVHGFRHSVATHLIEDGMDVRYVQVLLGHDSIQSTKIYTHVERKTLLEQLKAHHPRELAGETLLPFTGEEKEAHAAVA
jgi:integrase/recombinase XerD